MKTAPHRKTRMLLAFPAAVVVAAVIGTPAFAATLTPSAGPSAPTTVQPAPAQTTQGIIMRDGGVCDPIRHMGC